MMDFAATYIQAFARGMIVRKNIRTRHPRESTQQSAPSPEADEEDVVDNSPHLKEAQPLSFSTSAEDDQKDEEGEDRNDDGEEADHSVRSHVYLLLLLTNYLLINLHNNYTELVGYKC
jgi:hypothetical protein